MIFYLMSLVVSILIIIAVARNAVKRWHHNQNPINGDAITDSIR